MNDSPEMLVNDLLNHICVYHPQKLTDHGCEAVVSAARAVVQQVLTDLPVNTNITHMLGLFDSVLRVEV